MSHRTTIIAGALGLACLTLTGCVSEGGSYSDRSYSSYNPVYDRGDRDQDRYWRNRRDRDHHRGPQNSHNDRGNHGRPGVNQAAYDRDKPDPTWAGRGQRGRDNGPSRTDADRSNGFRSGGRDILIPSR
jgi:hypothetical protein